jgi:hypothetical protein
MAFTLVDSFGAANDDDNGFGANDFGQTPWIAYSFVPGSSYTCTQLGLGIFRYATATANNVTAYLYSDSSLSPLTLLATSTNTIAGSALNAGSPTEQLFQFSGQALTGGTRYWAAVMAPVDNVNHCGWACQDASPGSEDFARSSDGSIWVPEPAFNTRGQIKTYITISAALTGTMTAGVTEADIRAGGKVLTITLTGDTWIP